MFKVNVEFGEEIESNWSFVVLPKYQTKLNKKTIWKLSYQSPFLLIFKCTIYNKILSKCNSCYKIFQKYTIWDKRLLKCRCCTEGYIFLNVLIWWKRLSSVQLQPKMSDNLVSNHVGSISKVYQLIRLQSLPWQWLNWVFILDWPTPC